MSFNAQTRIEYTLNTQAIEGVIPSKDALSLCERLSSGKESADSAIEAIKRKYGLRMGGAHA